MCSQLEQDFEVATNEYEYINTALKQDLPRFMVLSTQFIDPLYQSFYYMQSVTLSSSSFKCSSRFFFERLNIFYMILEKISGFSEGKYDVHVSAAQITDEYENKRTDAWEVIENLNITKRIVSTQKMLQNHRANSGSSGAGSARSPPPSMGRSVSGGSFVKKAPPPPPSSSSFTAAPPPYSASAAGAAAAASAAAAKRAPPPPPPLKPKPRVEPPVQYVVALYDFAPQVR